MCWNFCKRLQSLFQIDVCSEHILMLFPLGGLVRQMYLMAKGSFPGGSDGKASAYNAGDLGSIPGLGRSPGEGNGNPLQYSCLENPTDRGAW